MPDDCRPQSLEEGYAIQEALAAQHGGELIGWKIAATSANGQRHIGVSEPLGGRLFAQFCHPDGARLPAGPLHMRVAEAEFAFRMAKDLPPRRRPLRDRGGDGGGRHAAPRHRGAGFALS